MFSFLKIYVSVFAKATLVCFSLWAFNSALAQDGLRGDTAAIEKARAMVETMGGIEVWGKIESLHFVHEWDLANRQERYLEDEILDLTGPRSFVSIRSESYERDRAYSPEFKYWTLENGEFSAGSENSLERAISRAPYSIYRLARAIARNDPALTITMGKLPKENRINALEFSYGDGEPGGWIVLNARNEPVVWETKQYVYDFGPLERFGNLWVPDWATTSFGLVRYQMVSLKGSFRKPDSAKFAPPEPHSTS